MKSLKINCRIQMESLVLLKTFILISLKESKKMIYNVPIIKLNKKVKIQMNYFKKYENDIKNTSKL